MRQRERGWILRRMKEEEEDMRERERERGERTEALIE